MMYLDHPQPRRGIHELAVHLVQGYGLIVSQGSRLIGSGRKAHGLRSYVEGLRVHQRGRDQV